MKGLHADTEIADEALNIAPDTFLQTDTYRKFLLFRQTKMDWMDRLNINVQNFVPNNPRYYDAYRLAGDYYKAHKNYNEAISNYRLALTMEVATINERKAIEDKIKDCSKAGKTDNAK